MREIVGDIWEAHELGNWITITTNGVVNKHGRCVMGRGVAKQAATKFPSLPGELGSRITEDGNVVQFFPQIRLITFPVKHHWKMRADPELIIKSAKDMVDRLDRLVDPLRKIDAIFLVRPGCGNGGLAWEKVKLLIGPILDDRFIVIERG